MATEQCPEYLAFCILFVVFIIFISVDSCHTCSDGVGGYNWRQGFSSCLDTTEITVIVIKDNGEREDVEAVLSSSCVIPNYLPYCLSKLVLFDYLFSFI